MTEGTEPMKKLQGNALCALKSAIGIASESHLNKDDGHRVGLGYVLWCEAHHGEPLDIFDPELYDKIATLLQTMAGVKIPTFVLNLLTLSHRKALGPVRRCQEMQDNHNAPDVLNKLETLRRMHSDASKREFAILLGEVMTALFRKFGEVIQAVPDDIMQKSMTNLAPNQWSKVEIKNDFSHSVGEISPGTTTESVITTESLPIQPIEATVKPIKRAKPESKLNSTMALSHPKDPNFVAYTLEESAIEIQFQLNGLTNGYDPAHRIYPVLSGTSVIQDPTVDTGEHCPKSRGLKHASWKRARRIRRLFRRTLTGCQTRITTCEDVQNLCGSNLDQPFRLF